MPPASFFSQETYKTYFLCVGSPTSPPAQVQVEVGCLQASLKGGMIPVSRAGPRRWK